MAVQPKKTDDEHSKVRLSVTLPVDDYRELKRLSESNRVSVAWLVRNAVTEYLEAQAPLFAEIRTRS